MLALSCIVCPSKKTLTAPGPLLLLSLRRLSACPSILPSVCWQFHHPLLSVHPSVWPAVCPVLAVLTAPWSHAVVVFCSVMATGATPALSQSMDRQPFFLTVLFEISFPSKVYFTHSLACCSSISLSSFSISILLHSWPSCCLAADRKKDWKADR